jgi:hypothetical protein
LWDYLFSQQLLLNVRKSLLLPLAKDLMAMQNLIAMIARAEKNQK